MLKKIIFQASLLILAFGILFTSVWKTAAQTMQESENLGQEATSEHFRVASVASPAAEKREGKVEYELTWPGILPDHFLYPIKMVRDRIWLWLTTDSLKKAELLLRFADKRIWSAQMLVDKGKVDLGVTTATKAEKYLEQAVNQEKIAREQGKDTRMFLQRLAKASFKHEEVLLEMWEKVPQAARPVIDNCLGYARQGNEQAQERLKK